MKLNSLLFVSVAAILVVGGGGYWFFNRDNDEVRWRTSRVERGEVRKRVSATGTLSALNQVPVGTQVSGMVTSLNADFNSIVKKGQVLATIDDLLYKQRLQSAENNLENQRTALEDAERQYNREKELFDNKLVSVANMEAREVTLNRAKISYDNALIDVAQRQLDLEYCTIKAQMDGIIISRIADVGETVQASMSVPRLFTLAEDLGTMKLEINMDEADIAEVSVGQIANFTVDSVGSDTPFYGTVAQVRLDSVSQQNVVNYKVVVEVQNRTKQEIEAEKELARERRQAMLAAMESGQFPGQGERGEQGDRGDRSRGSRDGNSNAGETREQPNTGRPGNEPTARSGEGNNPQGRGGERQPGGGNPMVSMIITGADGQPDFDATWEARKEQILEREPDATKEAWVERMRQMTQRRPQDGSRQSPGAPGGGPFRMQSPPTRPAPATGGSAPNSPIIKAGGEFYQGDYVLRPGMTANVTIITKEKQDVLRVPNVALRFVASQYVKDYVASPGAVSPGGPGGGPGQGAGGAARPGQPRNMAADRRARVMDRGLVAMRDDRIWVLDDKGKVKSIPVVVGLADNQFSEISGAGLSEDMEILVGVEEGKRNNRSQSSSPFGGGGGMMMRR